MDEHQTDREIIMGTLEYVTAQHIAEIDDRTLAHLQIVICNKLRRDERFTLTLSPTEGASGPKSVLWLTSSLPLRFTYSSPEPQIINRAWLNVLADAAFSSAGLRLIPEPEPGTPSSRRPARREDVPA